MAQRSDRKAILAAARTHFERVIGGKLVFKVSTLRQKGDWAFLIAQPLRPGNKRIDWSRTRYAEDYESGAFDEEVIGLVKRTRGVWRVVVGIVGATDVPWGCWWKRYGAPKSIFTYVEEDCTYMED